MAPREWNPRVGDLIKAPPNLAPWCTSAGHGGLSQGSQKARGSYSAVNSKVPGRGRGEQDAVDWTSAAAGCLQTKDARVTSLSVPL